VTARHRSALTCLFSTILAAACLLSCLCTVGGLSWWAATHPIPPHSPTPIPPFLHTPTPSYPYTSTPTPTVIPTPTSDATARQRDATARQLRVFSELWQIVHDEYLYPDYNGADWGDIGQEYQALIEAGLSDEAFWITMDEMLVELNDEHSAFLSPAEAVEEDEMLAGGLDYVGIGVYNAIPLEPEKEYVVVLLVLPDSPADQAGLQPHDRILTVDGHPACCDAAGFSYLERLTGPEGRAVQLRVQTPGERARTVTVRLARVQGALPIEVQRIEGNIGYILIPTLWDDTIVGRVRQALEELTAEKDIDGLVLDLRVNSGGSDTVLKGLLELFADGELGRFVGRRGAEPLRVAGIDIGGSQRVPLVVLVGRETASFAEVFSGVLWELGRAQIVGRTTFGNVEITYGYDFEDGSRAWIAQETFRPPSGTDWEKTGIVPDVEIPLDWDEFTVEDDPQLDAALDLLRTR
jgi:carboxyl-terminal processing protease